MISPTPDSAPTMTVGELIEELKKKPLNAVVYIDDCGSVLLPVVHLQDDHIGGTEFDAVIIEPKNWTDNERNLIRFFDGEKKLQSLPEC